MSYAIIRNEKYTRSNLMGIYRHNERKNTSYTNKNINHQKSYQNYSIKSCDINYLKKFDQIRQDYNLKGWIKKNSNIVCEYIITSDEEFFKSIGEDETKRYFKTAYEFVKNYKNLGEEYILSANVHLDEITPHMHLTFIPVIHSFDTKSGKQVEKLCCSEFWKGKDSYKILQDNFHKYMVRSGFDLERGRETERKNLSVQKFKEITDYEVQEMFRESQSVEQELQTNNIEELKIDYKRVIKKFNTLAKHYTRVKTITDKLILSQEKLQQENQELKEENRYLENENNKLTDFLEKTYEYVSILFNFPKDRLKRLVKDFVNKMKGK